MSSHIGSLPVVLVALDGAELPAAQTSSLVGVRVQQRCNVPAVCELTFAEGNGALPDAGLGSALRVGVRGLPDPLFAGEVTAIHHGYAADGNHELRLRAYDNLHRLRKKRQMVAHTDVTPAGIASVLTAGTGLDVRASADGPPTKRLFQRGESDLDVLNRVCARAGLWFSVRDATLYLFDAAGLSGADVALRLGEGLREAGIDVNADAACAVVKGTGWDVASMETRSAEANQPRSGRRVAASAPPQSVSSDGVVFVEDLWVHDDGQLRAGLQGRLDRDDARGVIFRGVAEGNPRLRPGATIAVSGVASAMAGRYVVTAVDHVIDQDRGFVSELSTEPPPPPAPAAGATSPALSLGRVVAVNDPDGHGRVRVALSTLGDCETDWMPVLTPGAGAGKGLVCLPDIGDQVLVLSPSGNLDNALVAGGLYGAGVVPDPGVDGSSVRRYTWTTPGGQRIRLNDSDRKVQLDDTTGNRIELGPDLVSIHAITDLVIEAPGRGVRIRAKTIDFETAP